MVIKKRENIVKRLEETRATAAAKKEARDKRNAALRFQHSLRDDIPVIDLLRGLRGLPVAGHPTSFLHKASLSEDYIDYRMDRVRSITDDASAIVAYCAGCQCSTNEEEAKARVLACSHVGCPLWSFRTGDNPLFRKKR